MTNSIIIFFLAWEGIGICSYFLISYWNLRNITTSGATKVIIVNRVADILLFVVVVLLTHKLNIFYFSEVASVWAINQYYTKIIVFFIFLTAACKSAQFPFTS